MSAKTKVTAKQKPANQKSAAPAQNDGANELREAIRAEIANDANTLRERVEMLAAVDVSKLDPVAKAQHAQQVLDTNNIHKRISRMAAAMQSDSYADAFLEFELTLGKVHALAIYAQDKLHQTLLAIAQNVPLSLTAGRGHANMSTQAVVQLLKTAPRTQKEIVHDMHAITGKPESTRSTQASSSRRMLESLGMLSFDTLSKRFSLNERGMKYADILGR